MNSFPVLRVPTLGQFRASQDSNNHPVRINWLDGDGGEHFVDMCVDRITCAYDENEQKGELYIIEGIALGVNPNKGGCMRLLYNKLVHKAAVSFLREDDEPQINIPPGTFYCGIHGISET